MKCRLEPIDILIVTLNAPSSPCLTRTRARSRYDCGSSPRMCRIFSNNRAAVLQRDYQHGGIAVQCNALKIVSKLHFIGQHAEISVVFRLDFGDVADDPTNSKSIVWICSGQREWLTSIDMHDSSCHTTSVLPAQIVQMASHCFL